MTFAEIHTPCGVGDSPVPDECPSNDHVADGLDTYRRRCRVVRLPVGGHLWFGAERPDGVQDWLQVGDRRPRPPYPISRVVGRFWFTPPSEGARLLVENLSGNNTLELRSPRLPQPVTIFPVMPADEDDVLSEVVGTPMVAIQAARTTLTISNQSTSFTVWIKVPISPVLPPRTLRTVDPRVAAEGLDQRELDEAALRIQLAAPENYELLREFVDDPAVQKRLRNSPTLRAHLATVNPAGTTWRDFADKELTNVREEQPTHEIHRLILEAVGTPPARKQSRGYTELVARHLQPDRTRRTTRGGVNTGLNHLIPKVKGHWAYRRWQLEDYLNQGR